MARHEAIEAVATRRAEGEWHIRGAQAPLAQAETVLEAVPLRVVKTIDLDSVQKTLNAEYPTSASFLAATGYFALPAPIEPVKLMLVGYDLVFMDLHSSHIGQKSDQVKALFDFMHVQPIGFLALERLNFTALGYVRGDLVYSLPLVPGEKVRLSHREWSRTEEEYVKLVATSLETATEDALSEKSELTHSYGSEQRHSSAFNASASVSGGYGSINFSSSVGYNTNDAEQKSSKSSAQRSQAITHKASSRSKQEHKISFRVTDVIDVLSACTFFRWSSLRSSGQRT